MSNISPINQNEQWMLLVLLLKEIAIEKYGKEYQNIIIEETKMHQSAVSRFFSLKFKPTLPTFLDVAKAIKVNFFFQDQDDKSDLNQAMERAMEALGRRVDSLPKN